MKKLFLIALLVFLSTVSFSQSDYEVVQDFKNKAKQIENELNAASTPEQFEKLSKDVQALKEEFIAKKGLLDKSLYPETFDSFFEKLEGKLKTGSTTAKQITELKQEVTKLTDLVNKLSEENNRLLQDIEALKRGRAQDQKTIDSLKSLVRKLRENLRQRDQLLAEMVDSLVNQYAYQTSALTSAERKTMAQKVEGAYLFENVRRVINDNVKFLETGEFSSDDLASMKRDYEKFRKKWDDLAPKLAELYIDKKDRAAEIETVKEKFKRWDKKIEAAAWSSINAIFYRKGISINKFSSSNEFENAVFSYINDQMQKVKDFDKSVLYDNYQIFVDTIWNRELKKEWFPTFMANGYLSSEKITTIESKFLPWKEAVEPSSKIWLYALIAVGILLIIGIIVKSSRREY